MKRQKTNKTTVLIGLMIGTFLTAIEGTIVSTAMPKIVGDLQGIEVMDWVFSIFMLTSAITVPLFGKLADLFGRKKVFTIGTLIFLSGSVLCGLAWSMAALIVFRGIQGIGAGAVMTLSTTIIGDIFPVEKRAKMFGMMGMIWGIAGILGPLVGGFFVDVLSWHWIFFINLPFGIVTVLLISIGLMEKISHEQKTIDYAGMVVFSAAMGLFLFVLQRIGEYGWHNLLNSGLLISSFCLVAAFVFIESRVKEPLMPLTILQNPVVLMTNILAFLASIILIGNDIYMPMWLQGLLGYSAMASGFVLTPMSLTWMVGSFLSGHLLTKFGLKIGEAVGTLILMIGTFLVMMLRMDSHPLSYYFITAIVGIGFGITLTLTTIAAQSATDRAMRGAATASNQFFRSVGQAVGAAVFGMYFNTQVGQSIREQGAATVSANQLNQLVHPEGHEQLASSVRNLLRELLFTSIHHVFILFFVLAAAAVVVALLLPKHADSVQNE
ncbi:MDR family MFS transporter [Sporolactobacillus inulinus]|uniref:DSBA oxidoreductase n=1 Tax=Sporolactobacillus inulinus CASD TaxID=1069536 RepID=A0A0U1QPG5_9BACL|nr:MDR family MFS transporter [Sporolactobacillus inulinus]KLI02675.1 DSBA oxidoreductase [Sporolactobacillus inulinus CASD]GEB76022.1 MFS transporter [Sporolactobacillus inulinus]